jgi:hypothetical protein
VVLAWPGRGHPAHGHGDGSHSLLSPPPPMSPVEKKLVHLVVRTVLKAVSAPKTVESAVFLSQARELHGCNLVTSGSGLSKH